MIETTMTLGRATDADGRGRDLLGKLYFELAEVPGGGDPQHQFLALSFARARPRAATAGRVIRRTYLEASTAAVIYLSPNF